MTIESLMQSNRRAAALAAILVATVVASTVRAQPPLVPRGVTTTATSTPTPTRTHTPTQTPTETPPPESRIGIYANAAGTDCDLNTNMFNPFNVFILVKGVPGLTAADFKISNTLTNLLEVEPSRTPHPEATVTGNPSTTGAHVTFANCKDVLPLQIFRMTYVPTTTQLSVMSIAASNGETCPFIVQCDGITEFCVTPGTLTLNGAQPCSDPTTPTPTRTLTPTRTPTQTRTPTTGPSPTTTRTPTATSTPTTSATPTATATASATPTVSPTSSTTPTETSTPSITPTPSETLTPSITPTPSDTPTPSLTPTASSTPECGASRYDADLDGIVAALSDGLLILRYLFEFTGSAMTQGALGAGAMRTDPAAIIAHLDCVRSSLLDPDGDGLAMALTDGLLLLRYFFGFRGAALIAGAVGEDCTRCDAALIEMYIADGLN